jgi:hypothetical protein
MNVRGWLLPAALVVLLAGSSTAAAAPGTKVFLFRAFTSKGRPTIRVTHVRGSCFSGSDATPRDDAWRCSFGDELADPCFSSARATGVVLCPSADPASGTEITLSARLPRAQANRAQPSKNLHPWDLRLSSGRYCEFSGGATSAVAGVRLNYFCEGLTDSGLWGWPDRASSPWTIFVAPFNAKSLTRRVAIERAWT